MTSTTHPGRTPAEQATRRGWQVIPLRGKRPVRDDWLNHGTLDGASIQGNFGVLPGKSGLLVFDADLKADGPTKLASLELRLDGLPFTYTVKTGGGGQHYYFQFPKELEGLALPYLLCPGVELKGYKHQVVGAGSRHPDTGLLYELERDLDPAELPAKWIGFIKSLCRDARTGAPAIATRVTEGQRTHAITSIAGAMLRRGVAESVALAAAREANAVQVDPPLPDDKVIETVKGIYGRYSPEPSAVASTFTETVTEAPGSHGAAPAGPEPPEGRPPSTWAMVDMGAVLDGTDHHLIPTMLLREDGKGLVYPGKLHSIYGEPEAGKGWLCLHACKERLEAGESVVYIDFEDEARTVVHRLRLMGVTDATINQRFGYIRPAEDLGQWSEYDLGRALEWFGPTLVIIDGVTEAMGLMGYSINDNDDVTAWIKRLPRWVHDHADEPAIITIDHVVKSNESRGRWAIGGQHKLGGIDEAYGVKAVRPVGKGMTGCLQIIANKDRHGEVRPLAGGRRDNPVGQLWIESTEDQVVTRLAVPEASAESASMSKVLQFLRSCTAPVSQNAIVRNAHIGNDTVSGVMAELVQQSRVVFQQKGASFLYTLCEDDQDLF